MKKQYITIRFGYLLECVFLWGLTNDITTSGHWDGLQKNTFSTSPMKDVYNAHTLKFKDYLVHTAAPLAIPAGMCCFVFGHRTRRNAISCAWQFIICNSLAHFIYLGQKSLISFFSSFIPFI